MLAETEVGRTPVRLLGISVSSLEEESEEEQLFFPFYEGILRQEWGVSELE